MREVDLIVHGVDWLITMGSDRRIYRDGALALAGWAVVMEKGKISTVDEQAIYEAVLERQPQILEATGLTASVAPKWPVI